MTLPERLEVAIRDREKQAVALRRLAETWLADPEPPDIRGKLAVLWLELADHDLRAAAVARRELQRLVESDDWRLCEYDLHDLAAEYGVAV